MTISILGCGWLGLPLAVHLIEKGHKVKGSTTTAEKISILKEEGIEPCLLTLNPALNYENCDTFWDSDILILNIPPGRNRENVIDYHSTQIKEVVNRVERSPIKLVIFISSTSVYPERGGVVEEADVKEGKASRNSGEALLKAEQLLKKNDAFKTTVLRFGGLYGEDRHPVKYLAGKKGLSKGKAPVNLIHLDDCISIIEQIIDQNIEGEIFNAVSDGHPPRNMYYRVAAEKMGLEPPEFKKDTQKRYKVVSNQKLKNYLKYHFKYPNPLDTD